MGWVAYILSFWHPWHSYGLSLTKFESTILSALKGGYP
jgi:hypothetical protein